MSEPKIFRVMFEVSGLEDASSAYSRLLGVAGRMVGGFRCYFDCGEVILAIVDVSAGGKHPQCGPGDVYVSVTDLDAFHARAKEIGWLSTADVHGKSGGEIAMRPWGERSFYTEDPWGNGLCFVEEGTEFR